ncbi:MAG: L-aspartate oxidase [Chloroflexi bacterium]|nr:L-aspartate oxidase [Chloroflexota bacterium]
MDYDYVVIGSGIGGLYTALLAQQHGRTLILTKGSIDECNTKHAQGGIAAPIGPLDSPQKHYHDTVEVGAGLCDTEAVHILTEEAADRIYDLIRLGVPFDTVEGQVALGMEGGHSLPRVLHAGGDATGARIETTLSHLARSSAVTILEYHLVTEIAVDAEGVQGVVALDCRSGEYRQFGCRFLVLASGGAGQLFLFNTNPEVATADGVALAYRAGAVIQDMEFFQFHPTALRLPGAPPFLISEAVRGEGGILVNTAGERFMPRYHPKAELAARDIVARAILSEMQATGSDHVYLDITHLPLPQIISRFPSIYHFCRGHGLDITASPIPVAPAAHYMIGGVKTDIWGETNIARLFACGEVACTGVHGANRLASNSLLEVVVFAKRIIQRTVEGPPSGSALSLPERVELAELSVQSGVPAPSSPLLQRLMWGKVGIQRSRESLEEARRTLAAWQARLPLPIDRSSHELRNMVLVGRLITEAALLREESRGAHYRTDFPQMSAAWQRHIHFRRGALTSA